MATAIPLYSKRGGHHLAELLQHQVQRLRKFHPNFNLTDAAHFEGAAFLDTETTGLGGGAGVYSFMVGVGRFEYHPNDDFGGWLPEDEAVAADAATLTQTQLWAQPNHMLCTQPHSPQSNHQRQPTHFVVRQLFMRRPSEECSLLIALAELLQGCSMTVTFNGRTFDLPLLRTRYQQNRHLLPNQVAVDTTLLHEGYPHFDLLIPARRLWRRRLDSCRLTWLEEHVLEHQRGSDDVPGHLIPFLYSQFVSDSTGAACAMPSVFYHNREDIISMVGLATEVYTLFRRAESAGSAEAAADGEVNSVNETTTSKSADDVHGLDWLSLGCCFEAIDHSQSAEYAFSQALARLDNEKDSLVGRVEGYRRLGLLYKRRGHWEQATAIWQQWLSTIDGPDLTPFVELAKYCEWQAHDLEQAEMWTRWALHNLSQQPQANSKSITLAEALNHRLTRIQRKRASGSSV